MCVHPCGLYNSLCTPRLTVAGFDATLGTGGWLNLTRWGLTPHKKHQAYLGAPCHAFSGLLEHMVGADIDFLYYLIALNLPFVFLNVSGQYMQLAVAS